MLQVHKDNLNRLRIIENGFPLTRKAKQQWRIKLITIVFDAIFIGLVVFGAVWFTLGL